MTNDPARLLVIAGVDHYWHRGQWWAYGPYVREIQMWADLFPEVRIAAFSHQTPPPADCLPMERANVSISAKTRAGGVDLASKVSYLWKAPILAGQLLPDLIWADAVHVRNPSNLSILGVLLAPLFSKRLVSKYAGQWIPYAGEAPTVRLQRKILSSRWWRGPVTVYGEWPEQPSHVIPFFTSAATEAQMDRARKAVAAKRFDGPLRVLFVGRLSRSKNVDALIRAISVANGAGAGLSCGVIGVGPERENLEQLAVTCGVQDAVQFLGGMDHDGVIAELERSHILVLVSETEGWPKALTEAMAFGLICIASDRGLIPQLLERNRGLVVPAGDAKAVGEILMKVAADPKSHVPMSRAAAEWAQEFSLERLRDALRVLLEREWNCRLPGSLPVSIGLASVRARG